MKATIWAIPGFLGLPSDWHFLQWDNLLGVDLHAFSWRSLPEWAKKFNSEIKKQTKKPAILMGYSLGGRLALHALLDQPELWQAAIIIAAHSGLRHDHERKQRLQQDQLWAERFEQEEWESLMHSWNAQEIFANDSVRFDRQEKDYKRALLAKTLLAGSLAKQQDLNSQIAKLPLPILWITGENDRRYDQIAQLLNFNHPFSRWEKIAYAGHRAPWAQPALFSQIIQAFLHQNSFL